MHPAMNNAFAIPSMTLSVYAFLAAGSYSTPLARVLWWAGASSGAALAVVIVGNWLATPRHEGHVNGAWLMAPVGLFIHAVVGPLVDERYTYVQRAARLPACPPAQLRPAAPFSPAARCSARAAARFCLCREISFLFFGFASVMWLVLFVFIFQRITLGHNAGEASSLGQRRPSPAAAAGSAAAGAARAALFLTRDSPASVALPADPRMRMFVAIWFAAPAVASIAWTVITSRGASFAMDPIAQTLFYVALSMAAVCAWMAWRRFLWSDRFFMQMWAWGFPTAALAWAGVLYDATVGTALSKALAAALVAAACVACWVLSWRTLGGIFRRKVFVPEHKWGPMSHLPLAQEAMRAMLHRAAAAADGLAREPGNARLAAALRAHWASFAAVNTFYSHLKAEVCFPQIGAFFPGHQDGALARHRAMGEAQAGLDAALAGGGLRGEELQVRAEHESRFQL
jgi:hypothetical protein